MAPQRTPSRRKLLAATAAAASVGVAGCLSPGSSKGATDVVLHNERSEPVTVELTITAADESEPRHDVTLSLDPTEQATPTDDGKLPVGTDYTVEADVRDGPSETYEWTDVRLELAPLHVLIDDSENNVVFAVQVG